MGGNVKVLLAVFVFLITVPTQAQWEIQDSHTTASLRGIHNVGGGIAWASGTGGTILRTLDDGKTWQTCPIPLAGTKDTAEKLDFRGIQAFDAQTAIVMSSGPGDQSRLYKTTDGCETWKLLFTNPDKDGFWDAIRVRLSPDRKSAEALIAGDPVNGSFALFDLWLPVASDAAPRLMPFPSNVCHDKEPQRQLPIPVSPCITKMISAAQGEKLSTATALNRLPQYKSPVPRHGEALFAASNSSISFDPSVWFSPNISFVTGGPNGSRFLHYRGWPCAGAGCEWWRVADVPLAKSESSGAFSLAAIGKPSWQGVIVGGDYKKPDVNQGTGAYTTNEGESWLPAQTAPHGYRSAVAYDSATKTWITVGPNGTDISTDDGRNWRPLTPGPGEDKDADKNWNALSLPFVVGPKGRIGRLRAEVPTSKPKP